MGRNLTNLYISESFQYLVQVSGSAFETGLGSAIPSINITASNAVSSSYSNTAISSSYALVSTSSSFATNATSASYAVTASYALNATTNTGSLLITASAAANVITFTKGDGSTFPVTVATGSAVSASYALTSSLALNNVLTASVNSNTITFTKGDGTTFPITVNTGSATTVNTGSLLTTASISNATTTFTKGDGSTFSITANNVVNADSASVATSASYALSSSYALNATTASFAQTIASGLSPTFANVTASNVLITGTASVNVLITNFVSSSIIYSSGSNQFGDASDDVQTLWGTVNVKTGPVLVTGSVTSTTGFTGSLLGTASYATQALSASYALNATSASYTPNAVTTASVSSNTITFTKGDGSTFPVTVNTGSAAATFPYTGSAIISGSLTVTGSFAVTGSVTGNVLGNDTDTYITSPVVQQVVTLTQTEYNAIGTPNANTLYIISGSTPINVSEFVTTSSFNAFTSSVVTTSSFNAFTSSVVTTSSFNAFTGSVVTTSSFNAFTSSVVTTSSFNAFTGSVVTTSSFNAFTGSVATTGSNTFTGNQVFSGSVRGEVKALSISSQTASLDCSTDNFYTLTLVSGSTTFVNPSNILPGQTINLRVKQASVASGSISFASSVKQVSGSAYTPTATANGEDIVTFISFDSTNLYLSNIKNFI